MDTQKLSEKETALFDLLVRTVAWVDAYGSERYWKEGTVEDAVATWNATAGSGKPISPGELQRLGDALLDGAEGAVAEDNNGSIFLGGGIYERAMRHFTTRTPKTK